MTQYEHYKESGIFWTPRIPAGWETTYLRYILHKENREKAPDAELLICSNSGKVTKRGDSRLGLVAESDEVYQGVKEGDLLIHGMDTWHGAIGISGYDGMCTPVVHVCSSNQNKGFIAYYLKMMANAKVFKLISNGVRQNTSDFRSWDKVARLPVFLPSLAEQDRIVSFLDDKINLIESLKCQKERELQVLFELKQAEIAAAITHGLNPEVQLKESGIPWLPLIPAHWKVVRFGSLFKRKPAKNDPSEDLLSVFLDRGVIKAAESDKRTHQASEDLSKYQLVEPGDFVMNNQQAWRGSVGVSKHRGIISPAYHIFPMPSCYNPDYANYLLRDRVMVNLYEISSKGVGSIQRTLNFNWLNNGKCIVPPIKEQLAIVSAVQDKIGKIEVMIESLSKEIDCMMEYKWRLISDVVTGQIKVQ
jgi:type I restriction enzyme S subunit